MTVDQSLTPSALGGGEPRFQSGWLSAEEINEALGGEPDDDAESVPGPSMPPTFPNWPRVYPGL
jgi:hypothetical protein